MIKNIIMLLLISMCFLHTPLFADEPFELTLKVFISSGYDDDVYYEPPLRTIKVRDVIPRRFQVEIKNVSSRTESLYVDTMDEGLGQIIFEAKDENGNENIITKRAEFARSGIEEYRYFAPGETKKIKIILGENEWDNLGRLVKNGAKKITLRVIFKSKARKICSEYYTMIIDL